MPPIKMAYVTTNDAMFGNRRRSQDPSWVPPAKILHPDHDEILFNTVDTKSDDGDSEVDAVLRYAGGGRRISPVGGTSDATERGIPRHLKSMKSVVDAKKIVAESTMVACGETVRPQRIVRPCELRVDRGASIESATTYRLQFSKKDLREARGVPEQKLPTISIADGSCVKPAKGHFTTTNMELMGRVHAARGSGV
jgi:hypothetical protein